jgi:hypothetical protein
MVNILKIQEKIYVLRNVDMVCIYGEIYKVFVMFFIPPLFAARSEGGDFEAVRNVYLN